MADWIEKISQLDRRIVFLIIGLAVSLPLIFPLRLKMEISPPVKNAYNAIESLPPGSTVLISCDYDPTALAELYPMNIAFLKHLFKRNIKVIAIALWPVGATMAAKIFSEVAPEFNKKYGEDYVNLGFMTGGIIVIKSIGTSFSKTFPADYFKTTINQIPMMQGIENYGNVDLIIDLSAGAPGIPEWVQVAGDQFGKKIIGGCTAVSAPQLYPYYSSGQMCGLLGGLKGAAEYEFLLGYTGSAIKGMDSQSIAHLVIIIFVIIGNITFFIQRKKGKVKVFKVE